MTFVHNLDGNAFWEKCGFAARGDLAYRSRALREAVRRDG